MAQQEFEGDARDISPKRLIDPEKDDEFDNFFLVLADIFNDLKGLLFFGFNLEQSYRKPKDGEVNAHAGEYYGLNIQQYKQLGSLIREFLSFLKENAEVLSSPRFKRILLGVHPKARNEWNELQDIALTDKVSEKSTFAYSLLLIRNDIGFHYHQSGKNLRNGYRNHFYEQPKDARNERAYYRIGDSIKETRFYYADAAVMGYIRMRAGEVKSGKELGGLEFEEHQRRLNEMVRKMTMTIQALLGKYIEICKEKNI